MEDSAKPEEWERHQLWESLWALRPEIETLADQGFNGSERQKQLTSVIARLVIAEMNFRARDEEAAKQKS